jgi:hypothetical protein
MRRGRPGAVALGAFSLVAAVAMGAGPLTHANGAPLRGHDVIDWLGIPPPVPVTPYEAEVTLFLLNLPLWTVAALVGIVVIGTAGLTATPRR